MECLVSLLTFAPSSVIRTYKSQVTTTAWKLYQNSCNVARKGLTLAVVIISQHAESGFMYRILLDAVYMILQLKDFR